MSLASVKTALKTRLDAIASPLTTVWGNVSYKPVAGQAYQRAFLLPAEPQNDEISPSYAEQGVLQVNGVFPATEGDDDALAWAVALQAWFVRGLSLSSGGIVTTIERTPHIGPGFHDPDERWVRPVRIRYFAFITVA